MTPLRPALVRCLDVFVTSLVLVASCSRARRAPATATNTADADKRDCPTGTQRVKAIPPDRLYDRCVKQGSSENAGAGPYTLYWPTGHARQRGVLVDHEPSGPTEFFDNRGRLTASGNLVKGRRQGSWVTYWTGPGPEQIVVKETYHDGVVDGAPVLIDGKGQTLAPLTAAELRSAAQATGHPAPNALATGARKAGLREGVWTSWFDTSHKQKAAEVTYQAGRAHGPFKVWWPDGLLATSGRHDHGKRARLNSEDLPVLGLDQKLATLAEPLQKLYRACDLVMVVAESGAITALDWGGGQAKWSRPTAKAAIVDIAGDRDYPCTVRVQRNDGAVTFYSEKGGEELGHWQANARFPIASVGQRDLVVTQNNRVAVVEGRTGKERWGWSSDGELAVPFLVQEGLQRVADVDHHLIQLNPRSHQVDKSIDLGDPILDLSITSTSVLALLQRDKHFALVSTEDLTHNDRPFDLHIEWRERPLICPGTIYVGDGLLRAPLVSKAPDRPLPPLHSLTCGPAGMASFVTGEHPSTLFRAKVSAGTLYYEGPWILPDVLSCGAGLRMIGDSHYPVFGCQGKRELFRSYIQNGPQGRDGFTANLRWKQDVHERGGFAEVVTVDGMVYGYTSKASPDIHAHPIWADCAYDLYSGTPHFCIEDLVSFPVVQGGVLYYVAEDAAVAVDALTGDPVWRNTDVGPSHAVPPLAPDLQAPVATSADLLWTTFGSSKMGLLEVQALDLRTGSPRYRATFTPAVSLPKGAQVEHNALFIDGKNIAVLANTGLLVFDTAKPAVLWQDIVQTPRAAGIAKDRIVVLEKHELRALRRADGKLIWRREVPPAMRKDGFFSFWIDAEKDLIGFQADFSVRDMPGVRLSSGKPLRPRDMPEPQESEGEEDLSGPYDTRKDTETRDGLFAIVEMESGILAGVDLRNDPVQPFVPPPDSAPPAWKAPADLQPGRPGQSLK